MLGDVVQGLGEDPVRRDLDRRGQGRHGFRLDPDLEARVPLGEPGRVLLERPDETELVQRRRPQVLHQPADVGDAGLHLLLQGRGQPDGVLRPRAGQPAHRVEAERHPGERRSEAVVQVAADPAALLLAGADDALAGPLQVTPEQHRVRRDRDLPPEVVEQPEVRVPERVPRGAGRHAQGADALAPERQRHLVQPGGRRPPVGGQAVGLPGAAGLDPHVGQPERAATVSATSVSGPVVGDGRDVEPAAEPGQHRVGVSPVAVHQPVRGPLQPGPHRGEADRDQGGGGERGRGAGVAAEHRAEDHDRGRVSQQQDGGERAVDQERPATTSMPYSLPRSTATPTVTGSSGTATG